MEKELSWQKELELAKDYAKDGSNEWSKEHLERCLNKAIEKSKKEGINISKEVKRIKAIWNKKT